MPRCKQEADSLLCSCRRLSIRKVPLQTNEELQCPRTTQEMFVHGLTTVTEGNTGVQRDFGGGKQTLSRRKVSTATCTVQNIVIKITKLKHCQWHRVFALHDL